MPKVCSRQPQQVSSDVEQPLLQNQHIGDFRADVGAVKPLTSSTPSALDIALEGPCLQGLCILVLVCVQVVGQQQGDLVGLQLQAVHQPSHRIACRLLTLRNEALSGPPCPYCMKPADWGPTPRSKVFQA